MRCLEPRPQWKEKTEAGVISQVQGKKTAACSCRHGRISGDPDLHVISALAAGRTVRSRDQPGSKSSHRPGERPKTLLFPREDSLQKSEVMGWLDVAFQRIGEGFLCGI